MSGFPVFARQFKKNPVRASVGLAADYFIYVGMFAFVLAIILLRYPLKAVDSVFGLELREKLVNLVGKISGA